MVQDDRNGQILAGRYRLRRPIGSGAHGTVYCAEDLGRSGRHVALKLSHGAVGHTQGDDADEVLRHLEHPGWATVLDSGTIDGGTSFQATRLVRGRSLDHLEGPQPFDHVWRLLEDGARVLGALHRHGLIHYDVTPGNLILTDENTTPRFVLTDGGLAHVGPVEGVARGTPMYMAPEVTEGGAHDHRVDLYSLGLVAFRLTTGKDPIEGGAGEVLGQRRREDAPRASTLREDVPAALDQLLADLLARDPRRRPHDALALLERINADLDREVLPFLHEEGLAAAEGGPLVGRVEPFARFDKSLAALTEQCAAGGKPLARSRAAAAKDAVLLLHGRPGCGATRVAEEMIARARVANVPCLLVAGGDQTGDRRGPLRHLTDGLATLGLEEGQSVRDLRLDLGSGRTVGREERAHAGTRAVEQFLRGIEQAAQRTPFILVVQDFASLPPSAQEAIRVLSRHLLARREGGGRPSRVAVLLVVDLAGADPDSLLLPDAREPRGPLLELLQEPTATLEQICKDRFPGFLASDADLRLIESASEGLPGTLVSLLGEACLRGDIAYESGRWQWNVNQIDAYDIQRGLSPAHADTLRATNESELHLLAQLCLVEAPLPEALLEHLWAHHPDRPLPDTPLLQTSSRDAATFYSPVNLAVRGAVLARIDEPTRVRLGEQLLDASQPWEGPEIALDRARLAVDLGHPQEAMAILHRHWSTLPPESHTTAQPLILRVLETTADLLATGAGRAQIASMLEYGPATTSAAELVADALPEGVELETAEAVSAALRSARRYPRALQVLERAHVGTSKPEVDARLWIARAFLLFELHQAGAAEEAVKQARASLRQVADRRHKHPRLVAEFLMAEAQARFLAGETARSIRALRAAQIAAKLARSPTLRAKCINNMGIVQSGADQTRASIASLERALKLKSVVGDVRGSISTQLNLGRLHQRSGSLMKSAALLQAAASSARRHAQPVSLSRSLLLLAQVYDQQLNTRLAATTLSRAIRVAELAELRMEVARAVWDLAPLLAATDGPASASVELLRSAQAARKRVAPFARAAHHVAATLTALHLGHRSRAIISIQRAIRHKDSAYEELELLIDVLGQHLEIGDSPPAGQRPTSNSNARFLWRSQIWLQRVLRPAATPCRFPLPRLESRRRAQTHPLGAHRRILSEFALHGAAQAGGPQECGLAGRIERVLAHTGERYLQARALALRSVGHGKSKPASAAQLYSRAVQLAESSAGIAARRHRGLPGEHVLAYTSHSRELAIPVPAGRPGPSEQNCLAHRLLVRAGCTTAPDGRVASALRRVLEATGRMNAGAGLRELLAGMTHDTLEITGAERACVVLVDSSADAQVRVATSASSQDQQVSVEDLSQTVIQRVLEAQTPLLLHDVFDDEELMGRPSITDLSLRSILCVPMVRSDTLYGVLYADSASAAGSFDKVDLEVLLLFAEQAAGALETHRLVADVQNSLDELKAMQERLVKGERLRTMGELSSGVAHEFNNLLTSILARVQLINLTPVGSEFKQDLDLIEKACLDAAAVVRRLQNFTRNERQGHFVRLDLAEICDDAVEFMRPLWSTRRRHGRPPVHVHQHIEESLMVNGDPTELREVVTNLLKNALDALSEGGEISIAAQAVDGMVHLRVLDDGPGIPAEIQEKIFDPFYTTKGERGTGLGLCLSQQIIERHGGEISVESTPGAGAAFLIEIPAAGAALQLAPDPEDEPTHEAAPHARVLVVDDDANVREPLCRYLKKSGYDVRSAADGQAGLLAVEEEMPDVVITDVTMPVMDGLQLCTELRSRHADLPIVIMSGWSAGVDPARARRAGATALLGKPFALGDVAELLNSVSASAGEAPFRERVVD